MTTVFQDDSREAAMIELFDLYKDDSEGRSGIDAFLDIDGQRLPFELKTTGGKKVTTVRDFGPDHIRKWANKHWLIGAHSGEDVSYIYVSPARMAEWIQLKADYIAPDFDLARLTREKLDLSDLHQVVGEKEIYTFDDAVKLHKRQYTKAEYLEQQDLDGGYSPERMLVILKDRAKYIAERGSTLNNPQIPLNYFDGLERITANHADRLKELVRLSLSSD
ncbi:hypothetical protein [Vibrio splendidus]|uniref:hypothetical protein n=1 Tax=Vibrio splendidus TaxID=29497 RepID=UPI003D0C002E